MFFIPSGHSLRKVGYEKSIFTRTKTLSITICFKEPLSFITISQEDVFLFPPIAILRT